MAEATAGFTSNSHKSWTSVFSQQITNFLPLFHHLQSQDGLCSACSWRGGRAGIGAGLSPRALSVNVSNWVIYCHYLCGRGRQMELIKPPIPARDIYYKAGAILSFPSLPWIQLGQEKVPGRHPEHLTPNLLPAPRNPFSAGIPRETDTRHRLLPEMQP